MGSTIVMLVEIPEADKANRFDLNVKPGQKLQMGELITKEFWKRKETLHNSKLL